MNVFALVVAVVGAALVATAGVALGAPLWLILVFVAVELVGVYAALSRARRRPFGLQRRTQILGAAGVLELLVGAPVALWLGDTLLLVSHLLVGPMAIASAWLTARAGARPAD